MNINEIYIAWCHFQKVFLSGIIANFHWNGDLTELRNKMHYLSPYIHVRYDYPKTVKIARGNYAQFSYWPSLRNSTKVNAPSGRIGEWIDEKDFTTAPCKNVTELPQDLQPRNTAEKSNESVHCFLGSHSAISNLYKAPFQFDGTQYSCAE